MAYKKPATLRALMKNPAAPHSLLKKQLRPRGETGGTRENQAL